MKRRAYMKRAFSIKTHKQEILRDFMKQALYNPNMGYFMNKDHVQLGKLESPIKFSHLLGYNDYIEELNRNYPQKKFLTPSEIFRPFYGMSMACYMEKQLAIKRINSINVVEVGSGLGGQADSFLSYFKNLRPDLYKDVSYCLLEISPIFLKSSKDLLERNHPEKCKRGEIKFINKDAFDLRYSDKLKRKDQDITFFLFEILDNLVHDIIRFDKDLHNIEELWLKSSNQYNDIETVFKPIKDPLIEEVFEFWIKRYSKNGNINYKIEQYELPFYRRMLNSFKKESADKYEVSLPTGFFNLIKKLNNEFGQPKFLLSDFSTLPYSSQYKDNTLHINKPLITYKLAKSEEHIDFNSFNEMKFGKCDIFFATDFNLSKDILNKFGGDYEISTPLEFFQEFSRPKWADTKSGYNPMKEDFLNTRFLHELH